MTSRFWAVARRPRWIAALLLCLGIAAGFAALGQWQLSRSIQNVDTDAPDTEAAVPLETVAQPQTEVTLPQLGRRVTVEGASVDLSPREFSLLECLLRHAGQTLSRDQLLDQAWPFGVAVTPNAVDAYIHYLRDKLGSAGRFIQTVRGVGYRLADG